MEETSCCKRSLDEQVPDDSIAEAKRHNIEKQRRYMDNLRTPEKKTEYQEYRCKRAARQRELQQMEKRLK